MKQQWIDPAEFQSLFQEQIQSTRMKFPEGIPGEITKKFKA